MNEQIANKIIENQSEYTPTLSAQDVILITQALSAVAAAQPEGEPREVYTKLIEKLLNDPELTAELIDSTESQLQQLTHMLDQPAELGQKAFNYKHKRWDEPFDLEAVSDEIAKEYIPQDEFTLRTYDRIRKRNKSKYEALTAALQPHLEQEPADS
jgi:hypothetical protein